MMQPSSTLTTTLFPIIPFRLFVFLQNKGNSQYRASNTTPPPLTSEMSLAKESLVSSASAAVEVMRQVKSKTIDMAKATKEIGQDILYTSEAQFKNASLKEIVARGKLAFLSAAGLMDGTSASPIYRHRVKGIVTTRKILEQVNTEFSALVDEVGAVGMRFDRLCSLLDQFRVCCDAHITVSQEDEVRLATSIPSDTSLTTDDSFVDVGDEMIKGAQTAEDIQIKTFQSKMKRMISELKETIEMNCHSICSASIVAIDDSYQSVVSQVTRAQTTLDLQRRKVLTAQEQLSKLRQEALNIADGAPQKALKLQMVEQQEAGLGYKREEEDRHRDEFNRAIDSGLQALHFTLEQSSMSTWSLYNIFFSQMTNFFEEAAVEGRSVAKAFAVLKNNQTVSKKISEEKRQRMQLQHGTPTTTTGATTSTPMLDDSGSKPTARHVDVGDDFDSFVNERHASLMVSGSGGNVPTESSPSLASRGDSLSGSSANKVSKANRDDLWTELFE